MGQSSVSVSCARSPSSLLLQAFFQAAICNTISQIECTAAIGCAAASSDLTSDSSSSNAGPCQAFPSKARRHWSKIRSTSVIALLHARSVFPSVTDAPDRALREHQARLRSLLGRDQNLVLAFRGRTVH